jgi:hypothetical protein
MPYRVYRFKVDYAMPFKDMIIAGGYDEVSSVITEKNFPVARDQATDICFALLEFCDFDGFVTTGRTKEEITKLRYRPAFMAEFLAFNSLHPEARVRSPIAALGTSWQKNEHSLIFVPCALRRPDRKDKLFVRSLDAPWNSLWSFAAVSLDS